MELFVCGRATVAAGRGSCLEVLAFDSVVAAGAQGAVGFVVVVLAEWLVVDHVEISSGERLRAGTAREALLVPATGEATIGSFNGLSFDSLVATTTDRSNAWSRRAADGGRGTMLMWLCWRREWRWWSSDLGRTTDGQRRRSAIRVEVAGGFGRRCWLFRRR